MSESGTARRKSGKFFLKPPPGKTPGQPYSYTENPRPEGEVRFVLPGTRKKQAAQGMSLTRFVRLWDANLTPIHVHIDTTHFDSTSTPQPFLDPDVLERWRRERKE